MKGKLKKTAVISAALVMILTMIPGTAFAAGGTAIDKTHFPDAEFRSYVSESFDTDSDGVLSESEISGATEIDVSAKEIDSLKGIEYFTALQLLICNDNNLKELNLSKNKELIMLNCGDNVLESLDVSDNHSLFYLTAGGNKLSSVDLTSCTSLSVLSLPENNLTGIDLSGNPYLLDLTVSYNPLEVLDVSKNKKLMAIKCEGCRLTNLNVEGTNVFSFIGHDNCYTVGMPIIDLRTLPGNFDVNKASSWTGAEINGTILTFTDSEATYLYDCGRGSGARFTLRYDPFYFGGGFPNIGGTTPEKPADGSAGGADPGTVTLRDEKPAAPVTLRTEKAPATGDQNNMIPWIAVIVGAASGIAAVTAAGKQKNKK